MAERDDNRNTNAEGAESSSAQERRAAKPRPSVKDKQRKREARRQRPLLRSSRTNSDDSAESERERANRSEQLARDSFGAERKASSANNDGAASSSGTGLSGVGVPGHPEFRVIRSSGASTANRDVEYGQANTLGLASYQRRRSTGFPSSALVDDITGSPSSSRVTAECIDARSAQQGSSASVSERSPSYGSSAFEEALANQGVLGEEASPSRAYDASDEAFADNPSEALAEGEDTRGANAAGHDAQGTFDGEGTTAENPDAHDGSGASDDVSEGAQAEAAADDGLTGSAGEAEAQDASDFVDGEERTAEEDGVSNEPEHPEEAQPKDDELARQKRRLAARRTAQQEAEARRRTKHQHRLIAGVTIAVVLVTIALLVSWQRWWQFDDAVDLQGQWVTTQEKGAVTVSIDEHVIHLREDVGYTYTIDPVAKTIAYTFGDMEGHGRYWFSTDRDTLVIVDGENYTAISTLFEDIAIWWGNLFSAIQGEEVSGPAGYSAIRLNRAGGNVASAQATTQQTPQSGAASGVGAIVEVPPSDDNASSIDDVGDDTDYSVDSYVFDDFDYDASDDDTSYYEVPVYEEYGNEGFDEGIVEDEGVDGWQDGEL